MAALSQETVLKMVANLMRFPYPTICVHLVAADLLSALENEGYPLSQELARAVVCADNDEALRLLTLPA